MSELNTAYYHDGTAQDHAYAAIGNRESLTVTDPQGLETTTAYTYESIYQKYIIILITSSFLTVVPEHPPLAHQHS